MGIQNKVKRWLSFILLSTLLLTVAIGSVYAAEAEELDPDIYDIGSIEAGLYENETSIQLSLDRESNSIIIKFHPISMFSGKEQQYQNAINQVLRWGFEYTSINGLEDTYVVYNDELAVNPNAVFNRFKNNRFIESVEPNYLGTLDILPNDSNYSANGKRYADIINAEAGWAIITSSGVPIAIVDSGLATHNDLPSFRGYNILNKTTDSNDTVGHGTLVAGTVGASGNNGMGTVGVIWDANIIPVKITTSSTMTAANVASAITWAADNGARVINLSLSTTADSVTIKSAVDYAYKKGCILVAAVGNDSKSTVNYPAAYSNVLGVGATSNGTARNSVSNYGNGLDVLANLSWYSTSANGSYTATTGTSIATPQVAGLAALVWELAPDLTNAQVMQLIRDNTNRANGQWDSQTGYGTIDMGKTLTAAKSLGGVAETVEDETPLAEAPSADTTPPVITLNGASVIELTEGGTYVEPGFTATDDTDGDLTAFVSVSGTVSTAYAGAYTLMYTVADASGNTATVTRTINVLPEPEPVNEGPQPPVITQIGSNPIILHIGGSPYIEQGAVAYDEIDGDISGQIVTSGSVDTSVAGTYFVTYSVTNSAGLSASVTRQVRVLAPQERSIPRIPYNFNDQGKTGASFTHTVTADADGIISLSINGLNKTTATVTVTSASGTQAFTETFTGNASRDFWAAAGSYTVTLKIDTTNGNTKLDLSLLMPETTIVYFAEEEVPLADGGIPQTADSGGNVFAIVSLVAFAVLAAYAVSRKKTLKQK